MIVVLKPNPNPDQVQGFITWLEGKGITVHKSVGLNETLFGLVGDTDSLDIGLISALDIVADVKRIAEPYKEANRKFHPDDTVVQVNDNVAFGGGHFQLIAGPCSVESEEQITNIAFAVKAAGATLLRGGSFKPRTSPYAFQGLREKGLKMLIAAGKSAGMPVVSEIMDISQLDLFDDIDVIQVGARNMQNFELLRQLGRTTKPVLLKRGFASTVQELLMSAEYIMSGGNPNVILCERGIRTFETATRNTLDLSAVPVLRNATHLPVIVDPSHATGVAKLVSPMALAAVAAGCDGLIIEVHNDPEHALCDGPQSLLPQVFADLAGKVAKVRAAIRG